MFIYGTHFALVLENAALCAGSGFGPIFKKLYKASPLLISK